MKIVTEYAERDGHLFVKARGPWTATLAATLIDEVRDEAQKRGFHRILLDLRELSRPASEMTRFITGEHLSSVLKAPYKVAAFAHAEAINKFGETVARNRGANVGVFPDELAATDWLMGRPVPAGRTQPAAGMEEPACGTRPER